MEHAVSREPGTHVTRSALQSFRSGRPDCTLAVWSDIDTGLVLVADGDLLYPQEYLDAVCAEAARALSVPPVAGGGEADQVVLIRPTGGRVFVRDVGDPSHALSCICPPDADVNDLLDDMRALLAGRIEPEPGNE